MELFKDIITFNSTHEELNASIFRIIPIYINTQLLIVTSNENILSTAIDYKLPVT